MKKLILLGIVMTLAACNTMEGAGKDIKAGGENLSGAAKDVKHDMKKDERYPNN